ncbi:hypothetical protein EJB05_04435, partial [Eragrostis curvula]
MPTLTKLYSMKEAALHNTPDDCWVVIDGKVSAAPPTSSLRLAWSSYLRYRFMMHLFNYIAIAVVQASVEIYDVTKYLDDHPGGGKDATEEFDDAGHSKSAKELMEDYFIGELDPTPEMPEMEVFRKEDAGFASKLVDNAVRYWAIPAAAIGISVVVAILYARRK